jgi:hypothetical protein
MLNFVLWVIGSLIFCYLLLFPYMEVMGSLILLSGYCRDFILNSEKC